MKDMTTSASSDQDSLNFDIDVADDFLFDDADLTLDEQNFAVTGPFMLANNAKVQA